MGPGIQIDGEIGYTWSDADPDEFDNVFLPDGAFSYDALEIGIGTNFTF